MALIDHIIRCNHWDPEQFLPFFVGAAQLGLVRRELAPRLRDFPDIITEHQGRLALVQRWSTPDDRSRAFVPLQAALAAEGLIEPLRSEQYRVVEAWGRDPLMVMDRAAVPAFGVRAFGVHLNGMVRRPDGLSLWIAKRSADKSVEPGKLDNMVAGGQPAGLTLEENLIKEAAEEAGLPEGIACQARPAGVLTYCMAERRGLKRDTLFVYDLALPERLVPRATDGEVECFALMECASVLALLRRGFDFKFNVALVLIDFLIRHGVLGPDQEPDYAELVIGLHPTLVP